MKNLLLTLLLLFPVLLIAQDSTRIIVPGTKCSFERKKDFHLAKRFNGLEHISGKATIMVSVLSNSIEANRSAFTLEEMKKRGMTMIKETEPMVNGVKMYHYEVTQFNKEIKYRKYILIFGDSAKTIFINSTAPDSNVQLCDDIKGMVFSVIYNPAMVENLPEEVSFTVDLQQTNLKPAKYNNGGIVYTRDGFSPTHTDDQGTFIIGAMQRRVATEDKQKFALRRIKSMPGIDSLIQYSMDSVFIDGLPGLEINGRALNKDKHVTLLYIVMLFDEKESYYMMAGNAHARFDENLSDFRKVAKSFRRKKL